MTLFVEIVYIFITVVLILVVLLQAGRGGGLGTALGGGASQGVFGGGGGADFLAKLTQGLAAGFMVCAVFLAYASAHTGSDRLKGASDETKKELVDEDEAVDYERIGEGVPLELPEAGAAVITPTAIPTPPSGEIPEPAPTPEAVAPAEGQDAESIDAAVALPPADDAEPTAEVVAPAAEPATNAEAPTAEPEPVAADAG